MHQRRESSPEFPAVVKAQVQIEDEGRRRSERKPCPADVELLGGATVMGSVLNLSEDGLGIALPARLLDNTRCRLRLTFSNGEIRETVARVVWTKRTDDGCIAGLEFVEGGLGA